MSKRSLNIMQVLRAPTGGLWRHVLDLTRELSQRGHRVGLVCDAGADDAHTQRGLAQIQDALEIGLFRIPIARNPHPKDLGAIREMRSLAKQHGIAVMHGHGAKGGLLARGAAFRNNGLVACYTPHGGVLNFNPRRPKGWLFSQAEKVMLGATDAILFESAHARQAFARQIADPGPKGTVVHNGLRRDEFEPVIPNGDFDFVFVGELREIKGLDVLLRAMVDVPGSSGAPSTLAIAGSGPDADRLQELAKNLGLGERTRFFGNQPAREMFARGQLVVVPSRKESLPYIVLEASAANMPLIATRVGGIAEIFGPTDHALIEAGDVKALKERLEVFVARPQGFLTETTQRRDFVAEKFSVTKMCDQIENIYLKMG